MLRRSITPTRLRFAWVTGHRSSTFTTAFHLESPAFSHFPLQTSKNFKMPGLQNGSICWGNRKSFNVFADVFTDVYHEPVPPIVSNNAYYGYQRVQESAPPAKIDSESMDTSETVDPPARKRQAPEYSTENVKRVRQEVSLSPRPQSDPYSSVKSHSLGHCMV